MRLNFWRLLRTIIFLGIIIYFGGRFVFNLISDENIAQSVVYGQLNLENTYSGMVFRNEILISTNVSGNARYFVSDGEKIKKGIKVLEIYFDPELSAKDKEKDVENSTNEDIAQEIETEDNLSQTVQSLTVSEESLELEIQTLANDIIKAREQKKFLLIKDLKQDLDLKIDKKIMLKALSSSGDKSFKQTFVGQGELQEGQSVVFKSPSSGIVSFSSDDMESVLTLENIYKLDYENLMKEPIKVNSLTSEFVDAGDAVYKIVDNSLWMLVALIDKDEISLYEEGKYVNVEIAGQVSYGTVSKVFETGNKGALVLKMTEQIPDFQKTRLTQVKITRENYQGFKVPSSSIVLRNDKQGVFIVGVDSRAVFKPVQVIGYDDKYAIVKDGFVDVMIDGQEKHVRSIEINDEVLINGNNYYEGDKII